MKILLDAMGGDNAPDANIKGAVQAINKVKAEMQVKQLKWKTSQQ